MTKGGQPPNQVATEASQLNTHRHLDSSQQRSLHFQVRAHKPARWYRNAAIEYYQTVKTCTVYVSKSIACKSTAMLSFRFHSKGNSDDYPGPALPLVRLHSHSKYKVYRRMS